MHQWGPNKIKVDVDKFDSIYREIIYTMDKALFHIKDLKSSSFLNEKSKKTSPKKVLQT